MLECYHWQSICCDTICFPFKLDRTFHGKLKRYFNNVFTAIVDCSKWFKGIRKFIFKVILKVDDNPLLSVCTWLQRSAVCCLLWRRVRHDDWQSWTLVIMSKHEDTDSHAALSYAQINTFFECKDGVSLGFIVIVVLGILTMWYILFTKITMGWRKRDLSSNLSVDDTFKTEDAFEFVKSAIFSGRSLFGLF